MDEHLNVDEFGPVLYDGEFYEIRPLTRRRISENMLAVWNYAVINKALRIPEVHTDSLPGAMSILGKLDNGINECTKMLQEAADKRTKAQSRVFIGSNSTH